MMTAASTTLSPEDAERFRSFERQRHDSLATTYQDFFTPITALAIKPLLDAVRLQAGLDLLDVATGPGSVAAEAQGAGARTVGVDLSPGMIELAVKSHPGIDLPRSGGGAFAFCGPLVRCGRMQFWPGTFPIS
jgi:SAM-dependent methyltransferase